MSVKWLPPNVERHKPKNCRKLEWLLVNSMERRCKLIIENNGSCIPYQTIPINQYLSDFQIKFKSYYLDWCTVPCQKWVSPWNLADQTLKVVRIKSKTFANTVGHYVISKLVCNINVHMFCNFHKCCVNSEWEMLAYVKDKDFKKFIVKSLWILK